MKALGLDIGGANLKAVSGNYGEIIYFPMWKRFHELTGELRRIYHLTNPDRVGVVITAELSDCFQSRKEGIEFVYRAVKKSFDSEIYFIDKEGRLSEEIEKHELYFASNWVAGAKFLVEEGWNNFILADMGSTTTDLIPVTDKIEAGRADYTRLRKKELLYTGVLRTPVFYVLPEFDVPLIPEYFAVTADVFRITGDIGAEDYSCETPDGKGKRIDDCIRRLARCVCLDAGGNEKYVVQMAEEVRKRILEKVAGALKELSDKYGICDVLGCGIGEFLLERAAEASKLNYISLSKHYEFSELFPAFAISKIVESL
ncbi:MAG TPA: H4MPT-linked C1 transfer pathway protein [Archaeoglobaceae archaeon]|nr:H4MPT-linked C1 transfer pathway protein [Archaeoglobaceae archaeon]